MKCTFCKKDLGYEAPFRDGKDHYHLNCYSLLNDIENMEKETLTKLAKLIDKALKKL